ncbi:hypothetical protein [Nocardioides sp.]|uniref:hypothetical protein n=1 Tax=Nocardioides sp. TaxID=35761 RepID=UPI003D0B7A1C
MTDTLRQHSQDAADTGGRRRTRGLLLLAVCAVVVGVGVLGLTRVLADDTGPGSAAPPSPSPATPMGGSITVSGSGVGTLAFGTDAEEVVAVLTERLGDPDRRNGPQRYFRIRGSEGWFEDAADPISPSWHYPVTSQTCWDALCVIFGGDQPQTLQLRGWVLAGEPTQETGVDVRLAGSGVGLGDPWRRLHAAYPGTTINGGEGASLTVRDTPWSGIFDGVGEWRLSGQWDFTHPNHAPAGSRLIRLSGGDGPEPGCC